MSDIRTRLIRLAYHKESLRPLLLPILRESAMDRVALRVQQMKKMMSKGKHFAVLTPYGGSKKRSKNENKKRMSEFMRDLHKMGYRTEALKSKWEGVGENSVLVPNMKFEDAIALGKKWEQDAIVFKDPSGTLGMYYTKDGTAEIAVLPEGDMAVDISKDPNLYSKARGISFSFGVLWGQKVPWDGKKPLKRKQVEALVAEGMVDTSGGSAKKGPTFSDFLEDQGDKKVKNPDTGNSVMVKSLRGGKGSKLQQKMYREWKQSQQRA